MNKSVFMLLILLITFGFFTKIESEDRIKNVSEQSQGNVSIEKVRNELSLIRIYDEEDLLEISIEDVGKYHGDVCLCLTIAFKSIQFAISQLWQDEIPKRGDFKIISACPTPGSRDCFEFITRIITRGKSNDFKLELPQGTDIENMISDNFTFLFIRKSTGDSIRIRPKEGIFPDEFFELRNIVKYGKTAAKEKEDHFWATKRELKHKFMTLPAKEIFVFEW